MRFSHLTLAHHRHNKTYFVCFDRPVRLIKQTLFNINLANLWIAAIWPGRLASCMLEPKYLGPISVQSVQLDQFLPSSNLLH